MYLLYYTSYHYFSVYFFYLFFKSFCKRQYHVMPASASYISCLCLLFAPFPLVHDLILYCFITLVEPKSTAFIESIAVYSDALGLPIHSALTHPEQLLVLQTLLMVSALYKYTTFYLLYHIFTLPFLCLNTQTLTIVL